MLKLQVIKLKSNTSLIALVQFKDSDNIEEDDISNFLCVIKFPLEIKKQYNDKTGKFLLMLVDWIPETDDEVLVLPKEEIVTLATPKESLKDYYYQAIKEAYGIDLKNTEVDLKDDEIQDELLQILMNYEFDSEDVH